MFHEHYHGRRGIVDRVDYVFTQKVRVGSKKWDSGSVYFSIKKAEEGGWTFLGKHFNSIQGAKKEARRYCNEKAAEFLRSA